MLDLICEYMYVGASTLWGQKWASDPSELELQVSVNHLTGCWERNPGLLEKYQVPLTDEIISVPKLQFLDQIIVIR